MERHETLKRDLNTLYPVVERVPYNQRKALGLEGMKGSPLPSVGMACTGVHAKWTGEIRPPKKGEWFLSGSYVEAYIAHNDMTDKRPIAKLVKTETRTVTEIVEIETPEPEPPATIKFSTKRDKSRIPPSQALTYLGDNGDPNIDNLFRND